MPTFSPGQRVTCLHPLSAGPRLPGEIMEVVQDEHSGKHYKVRLDSSTRRLWDFWPEDLEVECEMGGEHVWVDGICEKCFASKEVK